MSRADLGIAVTTATYIPFVFFGVGFVLHPPYGALVALAIIGSLAIGWFSRRRWPAALMLGGAILVFAIAALVDDTDPVADAGDMSVAEAQALFAILILLPAAGFLALGSELHRKHRRSSANREPDHVR